MGAITSLFHTVIYEPLYNGLVLLIGLIPGHDVGLAVVILTIIVRIIVFPLSQRAIESQKALKRITPEIEEIKKKHPPNSPEQTQAIFALYKERGVRPFAGIGLMLLQLPILIGLFVVFAHGGLPAIHLEDLYTFVREPAGVSMFFLGFVDMSATHNILLAALAALTQLVYTRLSMGPPATKDPSPVESTLSGDFARTFDMQARYILPAFIGVIAFTLSSAVSLYFVVSNLSMIVQEYATGRRFRG